MNEPPLVLADEPTGNLDTETSDQVFDLLRKQNANRATTFLIVTHNPDLARRCDRVVELVDGAVEHGEVVFALAAAGIVWLVMARTVFGVERHGIGYGQPVSHPLQEADLI